MALAAAVLCVLDFYSLFQKFFSFCVWTALPTVDFVLKYYLKYYSKSFCAVCFCQFRWGVFYFFFFQKSLPLFWSVFKRLALFYWIFFSWFFLEFLTAFHFLISKKVFNFEKVCALVGGGFQAVILLNVYLFCILLVLVL